MCVVVRFARDRIVLDIARSAVGNLEIPIDAAERQRSFAFNFPAEADRGDQKNRSIEKNRGIIANLLHLSLVSIV